jgi:hypothetical protein
MENVEINGSQQPWSGLTLFCDSKAYLRNIHAHNFHNSVGHTLLISAGDSLFAEDVVVEDNRFHYSEFSQIQYAGIGSGSHSTFKRIYFRNNTFVGACGEDDYGGGRISGDHITADSIFFIGNHCNFGKSCGVISGVGQIGNIFVIGNTIGDESWDGDLDGQCDRGPHLEICNCSVRNLVFKNNTLTLYQRPLESVWAGQAGAGFGGVKYWSTLEDIEMTMSNCEFSDNFIDDHDVYEDLPGEQSYGFNPGRALYIVPHRLNQIVIDSCLFVNNRQPNHIPEWLWGSFGGRFVGSTIEVKSGLNWDSPKPTITISNCEIRDNDDGAIFWHGTSNAVIDNVKIIDTARLGIYIEQTHGKVIAKNILIDGTVQQDNWFGFPDPEEWIYQSVFSMYGDTVVAENVTITNSDVPIFGFSYDEQPERVSFQNFLIFNNQFDLWDAASHLPEDMQFLFQNSLIPEDLPGNDNLVGIAPLFDSDLGIPFLASDSPCIDAGDPNVIFNDIEDPANPGFAQWPSQGELRNDIGYTGGPRAGEFHFTDVSQQPNNDARPISAFLGLVYPNPFNPITNVSYSLQFPSEIKLEVYDLLGRHVAVLVSGTMTAGLHEVVFNGQELASGVYVTTLAVDGQRISARKMLLLK